MSLTNQSTATVTGAATVTANTGDVDVNATSNLITFNVVGMGFGVGQVATGNPGIKAGTSIGGSYNGENVTNHVHGLHR